MEFERRLTMGAPTIRSGEFNIIEKGKGKIILRKRDNLDIGETALKLSRKNHPIFDHFEKGIYIGECDADPHFAEIALSLDVIDGIEVTAIFFPIINPIDILEADKYQIPTKVKYFLNPGKIEIDINPSKLRAVALLKKLTRIGKICGCPSFKDKRLGDPDIFQDELISNLHKLTLTFNISEPEYMDNDRYYIHNPGILNSHLSDGLYRDSFIYILTAIKSVLWQGRNTIIKIVSEEELLRKIQMISQMKFEHPRR